MIKKVCHITSAHPVDDIRIFHKECVSLAQHGYEVHLVATGSLGADAKGIIHHAIPVRPGSGRLSRIMFRSWRAYRIAKLTQATVFHFHDPEILPYGLLLKWQGHVVIYDAHEDLPRDVMTKNWIPLYLRKPIAFVIEWFENFIARRLDKIVCATPFICKRFQDAGANAIDVKNYPNIEKLAINSELNETPNATPAVCYVGMISLQRGIVEMIQAVSTMNVRLIIAGSFVDKKTETLVRSLPEWNRVDYRGTVSRDGIARIFMDSCLGLCLLHPSDTHNESMPNKLFEYMSAGLPVLASNFVAWRRIVENTHCGLCVDPQDMTAIVHGLQWILDNPVDASQMGQRGQAAVNEYYNWNHEVERLLSVYAEV